MKLFEISQEFNALYNILDNIETDEDGSIIDNDETVKSLYCEIKEELDIKLESSIYVCKELSSNAKTLKDEAKRLNQKAVAFEKREKNLKELMKNTVIESGEMSHKTDKFSISVRSSQSNNYDDVELSDVDEDFIRVKREIDKVKIKKFIADGGEVRGVKIVESNIMTIR